MWNTDILIRELGGIMPLPPDFAHPDAIYDYAYEEIQDALIQHSATLYDAIETSLPPGEMRQLERQVMLRVIDSNWVQHLTAMENLRQGIGLHAFGQRDPLVMYKKEGHEKFQDLQQRIRRDIVHAIYNIGDLVQQNARAAASQPSQRTAPNGARIPNGSSNPDTVMSNVLPNRREAVPAGARKVGRNDRCPCGSGKKYKRCCGA